MIEAGKNFQLPGRLVLEGSNGLISLEGAKLTFEPSGEAYVEGDIVEGRFTYPQEWLSLGLSSGTLTFHGRPVSAWPSAGSFSKLHIELRAVRLTFSEEPPDRIVALSRNLALLHKGSRCVAGHVLEMEELEGRSRRQPGHYSARVTLTSPSAIDCQLLDDVLALLSVAQRSCIRADYVEFWRGEILTAVEAVGGDEIPTRSNVAIPRWASNTLDFVEQTHPAYIAHKELFDLPLLIFYYWRASIETTLQVKYLLGCVFFESMKFAYARHVARFPASFNAHGLVRGFLKNSGGYYSFKELLDLVAQHIGVTSYDASFIEDRNALFHSGEPAVYQRTQGPTGAWLMTATEVLFDQMDDFLLRLLRYEGIYVPHWRAGTVLRFPSREPASEYPSGLVV